MPMSSHERPLRPCKSNNIIATALMSMSSPERPLRPPKSNNIIATALMSMSSPERPLRLDIIATALMSMSSPERPLRLARTSPPPCKSNNIIANCFNVNEFPRTSPPPLLCRERPQCPLLFFPLCPPNVPSALERPLCPRTSPLPSNVPSALERPLCPLHGFISGRNWLSDRGLAAE